MALPEGERMVLMPPDAEPRPLDHVQRLTNRREDEAISAALGSGE